MKTWQEQSTALQNKVLNALDAWVDSIITGYQGYSSNQAHTRIGTRIGHLHAQYRAAIKERDDFFDRTIAGRSV